MLLFIILLSEFDWVGYFNRPRREIANLYGKIGLIIT